MGDPDQGSAHLSEGRTYLLPPHLWLSSLTEVKFTEQKQVTM